MTLRRKMMMNADMIPIERFDELIKTFIADYLGVKKEGKNDEIS